VSQNQQQQSSQKPGDLKSGQSQQTGSTSTGANVGSKSPQNQAGKK